MQSRVDGVGSTRHRADAVPRTTSRRWAWGVRNLIFTQVGELYDCFTARGATVVGFTDQDGYDHYDSKAIRDDKFCGLMCDEQNQMDQSEDRATAWVEQLKAEGMPL